MENGKEKKFLIVFNSMNHAYFLENLLIRKGFKVDYLQAPQYLSASCSASLKIGRDALKFVGQMINTFNLEVYRVYSWSKLQGKTTYRVVKI